MIYKRINPQDKDLLDLIDRFPEYEEDIKNCMSHSKTITVHEFANNAVFTTNAIINKRLYRCMEVQRFSYSKLLRLLKDDKVRPFINNKQKIYDLMIKQADITKDSDIYISLQENKDLFNEDTYNRLFSIYKSKYVASQLS